jgi:hypothetical protein
MYQLEGEANGFTSIPTAMYWAILWRGPFILPTVQHVGENTGHLLSRRACSKDNDMQPSFVD